MVDKKLSGAGLRGQSAGDTALCTVGKTGTGLTYRGYDISELAVHASFEEVAYLIFFGELPDANELAGVPNEAQGSARSARRPEGGARTYSGQRPSHGCHAYGLLDAWESGARGRFHQSAGGR